MTDKITGKVIRGSGDGTKLGFPTANILSDNPISLDYGVYATIIRINKTNYKSVTHYGPRAVFDETHPQLEAHVFDFNSDIYDLKIELFIYKKIRDTIKFDNLEDLIQQVDQDKSDALKLLTDVDPNIYL